jgi:hypothetical protein
VIPQAAEIRANSFKSSIACGENRTRPAKFAERSLPPGKIRRAKTANGETKPRAAAPDRLGCGIAGSDNAWSEDGLSETANGRPEGRPPWQLGY